MKVWYKLSSAESHRGFPGVTECRREGRAGEAAVVVMLLLDLPDDLLLAIVRHVSSSTPSLPSSFFADTCSEADVGQLLSHPLACLAATHGRLAKLVAKSWMGTWVDSPPRGLRVDLLWPQDAGESVDKFHRLCRWEHLVIRHFVVQTLLRIPVFHLTTLRTPRSFPPFLLHSLLSAVSTTRSPLHTLAFTDPSVAAPSSIPLPPLFRNFHALQALTLVSPRPNTLSDILHALPPDLLRHLRVLDYTLTNTASSSSSSSSLDALHNPLQTLLDALQSARNPCLHNLKSLSLSLSLPAAAPAPALHPLAVVLASMRVTLSQALHTVSLTPTTWKSHHAQAMLHLLTDLQQHIDNAASSHIVIDMPTIELQTSPTELDILRPHKSGPGGTSPAPVPLDTSSSEQDHSSSISDRHHPSSVIDLASITRSLSKYSIPPAFLDVLRNAHRLIDHGRLRILHEILDATSSPSSMAAHRFAFLLSQLRPSLREVHLDIPATTAPPVSSLSTILRNFAYLMTGLPPLGLLSLPSDWVQAAHPQDLHYGVLRAVLSHWQSTHTLFLAATTVHGNRVHVIDAVLEHSAIVQFISLFVEACRQNMLTHQLDKKKYGIAQIHMERAQWAFCATSSNALNVDSQNDLSQTRDFVNNLLHDACASLREWSSRNPDVCVRSVVRQLEERVEDSGMLFYWGGNGRGLNARVRAADFSPPPSRRSSF